MEIRNLKVNDSLLTKLGIEKEDLKNTLEQYKSMEEIVNLYFIPNKIKFFISYLNGSFNGVYTTDGITFGCNPINRLQETETGDCFDEGIIKMFEDYLKAYKAREENDYDIILQILS